VLLCAPHWLALRMLAVVDAMVPDEDGDYGSNSRGGNGSGGNRNGSNSILSPLSGDVIK
jgi:hypothetical protein